jgi:uncharacterized tellurite resistance protein B-like protein
MAQKTKTKQLMKILVGAAWIDGVIQSEEREYLRRMAAEREIINEPEIQSLLSEIKPVNATECYKWLEEYLGENHTPQDYEQLLEAISAVLYSDGDVDIQEAKLLSRLQDLDPQLHSSQSIFDQLLKSIQKLYRQAVEKKL